MASKKVYQPKQGGNAAAILKSFVERIERLDEEKTAIAGDIREVYAEAKGNGFDTKALRAIIRRRKQDAKALAEHEALVEIYAVSLGMIPADDADDEDGPTSASD